MRCCVCIVLTLLIAGPDAVETALSSCIECLSSICGAACVCPGAGKFLSDAIREADTDRDGRVSIDEFTTYYERLAR
jgi:hypothetical protein